MVRDAFVSPEISCRSVVGFRKHVHYTPTTQALPGGSRL
jgi:hypothetical protein